MRALLRLLLPVVLPSWRFFSGVGPSPRVDVLLEPEGGEPERWQELSARAHHLSARQMTGRLFHNPDWNEYLFVVSLSERLVTTPTPHALRELQRRIEQAVPAGRRWRALRLTFVSRCGARLEREVLFEAQNRVPDP